MRPRRKIFNCQRMCYRTAYVSVEELPVPSAAAVESAQLEPMVRNSSVGSASALVGGGIMVGAVAYENGFARGWEQRAENNFGAAKRTVITPTKSIYYSSNEGKREALTRNDYFRGLPHARSAPTSTSSPSARESPRKSCPGPEQFVSSSPTQR